MDALAQCWVGETNWAHPPWVLIPRMMRVLEHQPGAEAVVIVPHWPNAMWFTALLRLADDSYDIPMGPNLYAPFGDSTMSVPLLQWNLLAIHIPPCALDPMLTRMRAS